MKNIFSFLFAGYALTLITTCKPDLDIPTPSPGSADFRKSIALGDNFLCGYQDGALYLKGQQHSVSALLADQFALAGGGSFSQPLMPDDFGIGLNMKPWENIYFTKSTLGYRTDCNGITNISPLNSILSVASATAYLVPVSSSVDNFSAPFLKTASLFDPQTGTSTGNIFYHRFASTPGTSTVVSDAVSADASFIIIWTGMEDIYDYARLGGYNRTIPSPAQFELHLDSFLSVLTTNGAKGIIATIPSLQSFPFYSLIPPRGLHLDAVFADSLNTATGNIFNYTEGQNGFALEVPPGSGNYRQMGAGENILLSIPLDSLKCFKMGVFYGIPDRYSLDSSEVELINQAIVAYNQIIIQKAATYNFALADMNSFFNSVASGIKWDGVDYNTEFISGGFFSLDGYHPNQKGYALIANEFIKAVNEKYGSTIPPVNCQTCDGILFP